MGIQLEWWLLDGACLATCAVAAVLDVRRLRIPNPLTLGAVAAAVGTRALLGAAAGELPAFLLSGLLGLFVLLLVFGAMAARGMLGFGDAKLMAAVGAFLGWPRAMHALLYVLVCGGVLALGLAASRGRLAPVLRGLPRAARGQVAAAEAPDAHRMPYATAILAGTLWTVLARHLPALDLL